MLRRTLLALAALTGVALVVTVGSLLWVTKRAEPASSGTVPLPGLVAPVTVRYGPYGVPSIRAASLPDLAFAQGFVVAGERMWQMDLMRRLADGRLAEVFGPDALPVDRLFRTLGLGTQARRAVADMTGPERELLFAHAAGVNAYLEHSAGRPPIEYRIAGFTPESWAPADSLVIGAYLAWTQSYNLKHELTFLRLAERLGPARARELFPTDAGVPAPPPAPELPADLARSRAAIAAGGDSETAAAVYQAPDAPRRVAARVLALLEAPSRFGLPVPGPASNAWAVTGRHTVGGVALLANDPHLAPSMPSLWYELEIESPEVHAAGLALPGVPLVLIGHNADLAWGFTSAIADTQDVFLERIVAAPAPGQTGETSPDAGGQAAEPQPSAHALQAAEGLAVERADGPPEPVVVRIQRIGVKGAEAAELPVRSTRNGTILNALLWEPRPDRAGEPTALVHVRSPYLLTLRQAHDLPDRALPALLALNRARTLEEARSAVLGFRHVAQNLMVAHRDGGIAWQVSGLLPRRGKGNGAFPAPGWVAGYGWAGYAPQDTNPGRTDPRGGLIVTANNRTVPLDFPVTVSHTWLAPFRAERISKRLAECEPLTPADMEIVQADRLSLEARLAQDALRRLGPELRARHPEAWAVADEGLLDWDGVMDGASPHAALYALVPAALYRALYADELGNDLNALMALATVAYNPVQEAMRSGRSSFWDDIATPEREDAADIWARALLAARDELATRQAALAAGERPRLDRLRRLTFPHAFHPLPVLGGLFDVGPMGLAGGSETINLGKASALDPSRILFAPSARIVQTPADWSQTRGTLPLGQSGHRFSTHRADQLADWLAGRTHPWPWNGPAGGRAVSELRLTPVL